MVDKPETVSQTEFVVLLANQQASDVPHCDQKSPDIKEIKGYKNRVMPENYIPGIWFDPFVKYEV